ncbi:MAG: histidine kinase [Burkholderiales bacterium]
MPSDRHPRPFAARLRAAWQRSTRGFTWRRCAVLAGVIVVAATGHAISTALMPDKSLHAIVRSLVTQLVFLTLLFGTATAAVVIGGNWAPAGTGMRVTVLALAAVAGIVIVLAVLAYVAGNWLPREGDGPTLRKGVATVILWSHVMAAGVLGYFFMLREQDAAAGQHREDLRRVELERELAEARLQVMQAQVEPHFLFNTLAHVRRLFRTDAAAARAMLEHLVRYLSAMLPRMRSADSTLGHELALATAYLEVQKIRMGPRLAVRIDVPEPLLALPFPPMMLVTLVENAIRHGLNPLPQGGEVRIVARGGDGRLRVQVADTGCGLAESSGTGVGLANIRARLTTMFEGRARLLLAQEPGSGVVATIEVPAATGTLAARAA